MTPLDINAINEIQSSVNEDILDQLQKTCQLKNKPKYIVGFDVSHLQGQSIVASSVCFKEAKTQKSTKHP